MISDKPWLVTISLEELLRLQQLVPEMDQLKKDNIQLRRELEALRRIQGETLQIVGDLRRQVSKQH